MQMRFAKLPRYVRFFSTSGITPWEKIPRQLEIDNVSRIEQAINVTRSKSRCSLTADLTSLMEDARPISHTVRLTVHAYKVNGSVPPIQVTSGDCEVKWLDDESTQLAGVDHQYHQHFGIEVTLKGSKSFSLSFGEGVYVDSVYKMTVHEGIGIPSDLNKQLNNTSTKLKV